MVSINDFITQWENIVSIIKEIHFSGGYILANDYVFMCSELDTVNLIHLILNIDNKIITTGFIKPETILKVSGVK